MIPKFRNNLVDMAKREGKIKMKIRQFMMRYLRKRGWVVFYLEERARKCNGDTCWMKLYQEQLKIDDQEAKDKWFCAKCDPDTDKGKFLLSLHSLGRSKESENTE